MEERAFDAQLREIIAKINTLPEPQRAPLMALVEEARQREAQTNRDPSDDVTDF